MLIVSRCAANRCVSSAARKEKSEHRSAGQKLWKRRAKNALGNRFAIPTFPQLQQQQACRSRSLSGKSIRQRRFAPTTDRIHPGTVIAISSECRSASPESPGGLQRCIGKEISRFEQGKDAFIENIDDMCIHYDGGRVIANESLIAEIRERGL